MATSEALLTVVAIRLAALVVVGVVLKTAPADHRQGATACMTNRAIVHVQAPRAAEPAADELLRDMLLHD